MDSSERESVCVYVCVLIRDMGGQATEQNDAAMPGRTVTMPQRQAGSKPLLKVAETNEKYEGPQRRPRTTIIKANHTEGDAKRRTHKKRAE